MHGDTSGPGPRGKVARLLEEYDLRDFGDYLVRRWTAPDSDARLGLRTLADEFNVRLLEAKLSDSGIDPVEGTVERDYEALMSSDVSSGVRTKVRRTLEQNGVDVEELENQFVSRQAIQTYLTNTRGVSKPDSQSTTTPTAVRETIDRLRERTKRVTAGRLSRLRDSGEIDIGSFHVLVDVQVYCSDCGGQYGVSKILDDGRCNCTE